MLLSALALAVSTAPAARKSTVSQVEQAVAGGVAAHRADAELARQLGELELTERLSEARLEGMARRFAMEPRTAGWWRCIATRCRERRRTTG